MFSDAYMHAYLLGICLGEELLSHGLCSALADIGKQFSKGMPPIYKQVCCSIVSSTLGILSFYILAFYDCVLNLLFLVTKDVELFKINLLAILIFFVKCLFCPPTLFFSCWLLFSYQCVRVMYVGYKLFVIYVLQILVLCDLPL